MITPRKLSAVVRTQPLWLRLLLAIGAVVLHELTTNASSSSSSGSSSPKPT